MKQQKTRELLVTTKVAQNWQGEFETRVDELMSIVSKVDNDKDVDLASETLDVYNNKIQKQKNRKRRTVNNEKPFEFLVFRN